MIRVASDDDADFIVKIINDHPQGIAENTVVNYEWAIGHIHHDWFVNLIHNETGFIQYARFIDGIYNIHPFCYSDGKNALAESIEHMGLNYTDFHYILGLVPESNIKAIRFLLKNQFSLKTIIGNSVNVLERVVLCQ